MDIAVHQHATDNRPTWTVTSGTLAIQLSSKIVGESLSDDDRSRRVVDRFLSDLEQTPTETGAHQ